MDTVTEARVAIALASEDGLRSGMSYTGAASLEDLRTKTRLTRITNAGLFESHLHDVIITMEAPNYQLSQR